MICPECHQSNCSPPCKGTEVHTPDPISIEANEWVDWLNSPSESDVTGTKFNRLFDRIRNQPRETALVNLRSCLVLAYCEGNRKADSALLEALDAFVELNDTANNVYELGCERQPHGQLMWLVTSALDETTGQGDTPQAAIVNALHNLEQA